MTGGKRPIRLTCEYAQVICELLADLDNDGGQLPLLDGESVGARRLTPTERLAVDELRYQVSRVLGIRMPFPRPGTGP